jgi:hypothetical protein
MDMEERLQKLEMQIEMMTLDKIKLEVRMSELEEDHISLLLHLCVCNNDGGDNGACESIMHYCICNKLKKKTYDCRAKNYINDGISSGHKCVCPYAVIDGVEGRPAVIWCRSHYDLVDVDLNDSGDPVTIASVASAVNDMGGVVHTVLKDYNPRRIMRHFIARIKK